MNLFISYQDCGDQVLLNLPETAVWGIRFRMYNARGYEDYGLYLSIEGQTYCLRDTDAWCQGRPDLPESAVGKLYAEMLDQIAKQIAEQKVNFIDVQDIETTLISKHEKIWTEKGYIQPGLNGNW